MSLFNPRSYQTPQMLSTSAAPSPAPSSATNAYISQSPSFVHSDLHSAPSSSATPLPASEVPDCINPSVLQLHPSSSETSRPASSSSDYFYLSQQAHLPQATTISRNSTRSPAVFTSSTCNNDSQQFLMDSLNVGLPTPQNSCHSSSPLSLTHNILLGEDIDMEDMMEDNSDDEDDLYSNSDIGLSINSFSNTDATSFGSNTPVVNSNSTSGPQQASSQPPQQRTSITHTRPFHVTPGLPNMLPFSFNPDVMIKPVNRSFDAFWLNSSHVDSNSDYSDFFEPHIPGNPSGQHAFNLPIPFEEPEATDAEDEDDEGESYDEVLFSSSEDEQDDDFYDEPLYCGTSATSPLSGMDDKTSNNNNIAPTNCASSKVNTTTSAAFMSINNDNVVGSNDNNNTSLSHSANLNNPALINNDDDSDSDDYSSHSSQPSTPLHPPLTPSSQDYEDYDDDDDMQSLQSPPVAEVKRGRGRPPVRRRGSSAATATAAAAATLSNSAGRKKKTITTSDDTSIALSSRSKETSDYRRHSRSVSQPSVILSSPNSAATSPASGSLIKQDPLFGQEFPQVYGTRSRSIKTEDKAVRKDDMPSSSLMSMSRTKRRMALSHSGPHRCDLLLPSTGRPCNKIFSRPYDLVRHQDTIHASVRKTYICPLCGPDSKTFSRTDALTRHIRVKHSTSAEVAAATAHAAVPVNGR